MPRRVVNAELIRVITPRSVEGWPVAHVISEAKGSALMRQGVINGFLALLR